MDVIRSSNMKGAPRFQFSMVEHHHKCGLRSPVNCASHTGSSSCLVLGDRYLLLALLWLWSEESEDMSKVRDHLPLLRQPLGDRDQDLLWSRLDIRCLSLRTSFLQQPSGRVHTSVHAGYSVSLFFSFLCSLLSSPSLSSPTSSSSPIAFFLSIPPLFGDHLGLVDNPAFPRACSLPCMPTISLLPTTRRKLDAH